MHLSELIGSLRTIFSNFDQNKAILIKKKEFKNGISEKAAILSRPQYVKVKGPVDIYMRHFADDIFTWIFLNENVWNSLKISLKFVPRVRINNAPALV